ncbi:MAG: hypothetical protein JSW54_02270 [Fidelibacterota bacterium]|nr:MAG: hypothetical protein JSW54_02270 [Candidatus Neomarinimicrobiota bacterium]
MTRLNIVTVLLIVGALVLHGCATNAGDPGTEIVIGSSVTFDSDIYDQEIQFSIMLPDGYAEDTASYPVLYTLHTDFLHTAGAVEELAGIATPDLIYVHLETYNSGDLIPSKIEGRPTSGGADRLLNFVRDELVPLIDSRFRTQPFRIIHSCSWGGVFCLYALLTQPDVFNASLVATPWLIYDGDQQYMLNNIERFLQERTFTNNALFLALGNDPDPGLKESVDLLANMLSGSEKPGLRVQYNYWPEEDHYSVGHKTVFDGLRWIFLPWREIPENIALGGRIAIQHYQEELASRFGFDIGVHAGTLSDLGYRFMQQNLFDQAIEMFTLRVELSPDLPHSYFSLGRAYEAAGDYRSALENYQTARDLARAQRRPDLSRYDDYITAVREKIAAGPTDTSKPD